MLAVTSVIVEKCVLICFLTFYIIQVAPSKHWQGRGDLTYSSFWWVWVR